MTELLTCTPKALPGERLLDAARIAHEENPINHPPAAAVTAFQPHRPMPPQVMIAVLTTKYWRGGNTKFTVGFLDNPPNELRVRILQHMNAWQATADVSFVESMTEPRIRISRGEGGYWSYLGTDILSAGADQQTMNLEGFTLATPDSEFLRVVRHETGHTLGCPHEHMRADLVSLVDPDKAIAYFGETQGWSADEVRQQVLTPLESGSLWGTPRADMNSVMCYQLPGAVTRSGEPIPGGLDIDPGDYAFIAKVYPKPVPGPAAPSPAQEAVAPTTARHAAAHRARCADCIGIDLPDGTRLAVPPAAHADQLRTVLAALRGGADSQA